MVSGKFTATQQFSSASSSVLSSSAILQNSVVALAVQCALFDSSLPFPVSINVTGSSTTTGASTAEGQVTGSYIQFTYIVTYYFPDLGYVPPPFTTSIHDYSQGPVYFKAYSAALSASITNGQFSQILQHFAIVINVPNLIVSTASVVPAVSHLSLATPVPSLAPVIPSSASSTGSSSISITDTTTLAIIIGIAGVLIILLVLAVVYWGCNNRALDKADRKVQVQDWMGQEVSDLPVITRFGSKRNGGGAPTGTTSGIVDNRSSFYFEVDRRNGDRYLVPSPKTTMRQSFYPTMEYLTRGRIGQQASSPRQNDSNPMHFQNGHPVTSPLANRINMNSRNDPRSGNMMSLSPMGTLSSRVYADAPEEPSASPFDSARIMKQYNVNPNLAEYSLQPISPSAQSSGYQSSPVYRSQQQQPVVGGDYMIRVKTPPGSPSKLSPLDEEYYTKSASPRQDDGRVYFGGNPGTGHNDVLSITGDSSQVLEYSPSKRSYLSAADEAATNSSHWRGNDPNRF